MNKQENKKEASIGLIDMEYYQVDGDVLNAFSSRESPSEMYKTIWMICFSKQSIGNIDVATEFACKIIQTMKERTNNPYWDKVFAHSVQK